MPILEVRALPQADPDLIKPTLSSACRAIADAYGCEPRQVWGQWIELEPGRYLEGDVPADQQPADTHPPVARLLCFEGRSPDVISTVLEVGGRAIAEGLGIPGNIFVEYVEARSGRVIAGNGIVRR